ncbi:MAG: hypothetical protein K2Q18_04240, partial [Bdellovibrionales bacterium]|nr:hypothetical protein [Bdellovibrionales bacterium]
SDYLTLENSSIIAQAIAHDFVNLKTFVKAYKLSCDYGIASSLATIEQNISFNGIAGIDAGPVVSNDTKREPAVVKTSQEQSSQSASSVSSK